MKKSRLDISVGLLGVGIICAALFGGYLVTIILTGYVLLFEENIWLKKTALKATILMIVFSIIGAIIELIPGAIVFINDFLKIFDSGISATLIQNIADMLRSGLSLINTIVFLVFGFNALTQGTIHVPFVDNLINKHID